LSDNLDEESIIAMHDALLRESAPQFVGRWRDQQVWIGGGRLSPHAAVFVPPRHERIPALIDDLVAFTERTDVPALAQAAIAHAQFETIHPFPDGNGRTGRALIHAMLRRAGVTTNVAVPVSAGLLHRIQEYFDALSDYREGDVDAIVHALTNASFAAIGNGRRLVDDIRRTRERWDDELRVRAGSSAQRAKDVLLQSPLVTVASLAVRLEVSEVAAGNAISRLVDAGILTKAAGGVRYRIWQAPEIVEALDAFAERARRGRV
jgi:Fic family protein